MNSVRPKFDAHMHVPLGPGLLIGLEGKPQFERVVDNALANAASGADVWPVNYVTAREAGRHQEHLNGARLKYHPRREGYRPEEVASHISRHQPALVVIDTLAWPQWSVRDFELLVQDSAKTTFLLAHSGGLQIESFLPLLFFSRVYFDFSLTAPYFGLHDRGAPGIHAGIIEHCRFLAGHSNSKGRLLFGSDEPFFSAEETWVGYESLDVEASRLDANFASMVE